MPDLFGEDATPTLLEVAKMAKAVYQKHSGFVASGLADIGWEYLIDARSDELERKYIYKSQGYFASAYVHHARQAVVIIHRGTDTSDPDTLQKNLRTDIRLLVSGKFYAEYELAYQFTNDVLMTLNNKYPLQNYKFTQTGHSLGGFYAHLASFLMEHRQGRFQESIAFDAPGKHSDLFANRVKYPGGFDLVSPYTRRVTISANNEISTAGHRIGVHYHFTKAVPSMVSDAVSKLLYIAVLAAVTKASPLIAAAQVLYGQELLSVVYTLCTHKMDGICAKIEEIPNSDQPIETIFTEYPGLFLQQPRETRALLWDVGVSKEQLKTLDFSANDRLLSIIETIWNAVINPNGSPRLSTRYQRDQDEYPEIIFSNPDVDSQDPACRYVKVMTSKESEDWVVGQWYRMDDGLTVVVDLKEFALFLGLIGSFQETPNNPEQRALDYFKTALGIRPPNHSGFFFHKNQSENAYQDLTPEQRALQNQLIEACIKGEIRHINQAILAGASPLFPSASGLLPLSAAFWSGNIDVVFYFQELVPYTQEYWTGCLDQNKLHFGLSFPRFRSDLQCKSYELKKYWDGVPGYQHRKHLLTADWLFNPEDLDADDRSYSLYLTPVKRTNGVVSGHILHWNYSCPSTGNGVGLDNCWHNHQKLPNEIFHDSNYNANGFKNRVLSINEVVDALALYVNQLIESMPAKAPCAAASASERTTFASG